MNIFAIQLLTENRPRSIYDFESISEEYEENSIVKAAEGTLWKTMKDSKYEQITGLYHSQRRLKKYFTRIAKL